MGIFTRIGSWLDRLFDQLVNWLGKALKKFIKRLLNALENIWEMVKATLIAAYGFVVGLYLIFYTVKKIGETYIDVWNPKQSGNTRQFQLGIAPAPKSATIPSQEFPLPEKEDNPKIFVLQNS